MKPVRFHPAAESEMIEAALHYEARLTRCAGVCWRDHVHQAPERLRAGVSREPKGTPLIWPAGTWKIESGGPEDVFGGEGLC